MNGLQTAKYRVEGIYCPNCVRKIKEGVGSLEGVKSVQVEQETGLVEVEYEPESANVRMVKEKLESLHGGKFSAVLLEY